MTRSIQIVDRSKIMNDDQDSSIFLYDILVTMLEQSWIHNFPSTRNTVWYILIKYNLCIWRQNIFYDYDSRSKPKTKTSFPLNQSNCHSKRVNFVYMCWDFQKFYQSGVRPPGGRRLYTASCRIRMKWPSGRCNPLYCLSDEMNSISYNPSYQSYSGISYNPYSNIYR